MSEQFNVQVKTREEYGKNANRRLRAGGQIPAVLYGTGNETVPIQVERRKMEEMFRHGATENTIFLLKRQESDQERHARIREMQTHPISREILHIDFQRVLMDQLIRVTVPVHPVGTPKGVTDEGGVMDQVTREVDVECLPGDIPEALEVDVTALMIGDHLEASALSLPNGVELLEEADRVIVSVAYADRIEEPEEDEEDALLEAEADEPEVIRRGKEGEDGAEEGGGEEG
jgi:large subunit ribosomal protein L25